MIPEGFRTFETPSETYSVPWMPMFISQIAPVELLFPTHQTIRELLKQKNVKNIPTNLDDKDELYVFIFYLLIIEPLPANMETIPSHFYRNVQTLTSRIYELVFTRSNSPRPIEITPEDRKDVLYLLYNTYIKDTALLYRLFGEINNVSKRSKYDFKIFMERLVHNKRANLFFTDLTNLKEETTEPVFVFNRPAFVVELPKGNVTIPSSQDFYDSIWPIIKEVKLRRNKPRIKQDIFVSAVNIDWYRYLFRLIIPYENHEEIFPILDENPLLVTQIYSIVKKIEESSPSHSEFPDITSVSDELSTLYSYKGTLYNLFLQCIFQSNHAPAAFEQTLPVTDLNTFIDTIDTGFIPAKKRSHWTYEILYYLVYRPSNFGKDYPGMTSKNQNRILTRSDFHAFSKTHEVSFLQFLSQLPAGEYKEYIANNYTEQPYQQWLIDIASYIIEGGECPCYSISQA